MVSVQVFVSVYFWHLSKHSRLQRFHVSKRKHKNLLFSVYEKVSRQPACSATEYRQSLKLWKIEGIVKKKIVIRLPMSKKQQQSNADQTAHMHRICTLAHQIMLNGGYLSSRLIILECDRFCNPCKVPCSRFV